MRWIAERDIVMAFLFVRLSVRHVVLLCLNECSHRQTFPTFWQGHHSSFGAWRYKIPKKTLSGDVNYVHG